jgi:hypothetical protein
MTCRSRRMAVVSIRRRRSWRSSTSCAASATTSTLMIGPDPPGSFDIDRIVEVFARHGVSFLLVGGIAGRLYGAARPTFDVDMLASRGRDNLDRVAAALVELGAFLRVADLDDDTARALPVMLDGQALAAMELSTWRTDAGDIDVLVVLRDRDGARLTFDDIVGRASVTSVAGVEVRLASLDDIIASKVFANRAKDREAIPELEALRDESP